VRVVPSGQIDSVIKTETLNPANCTFGNSDRSTLFVISAALDTPPRDRHAGGLFALTTEISSSPEHGSRVLSHPRQLHDPGKRPPHIREHSERRKTRFCLGGALRTWPFVSRSQKSRAGVHWLSAMKQALNLIRPPVGEFQLRPPTGGRAQWKTRLDTYPTGLCNQHIGCMVSW
jgi:hypothetical protein